MRSSTHIRKEGNSDVNSVYKIYNNMRLIDIITTTMNMKTNDFMPIRLLFSWAFQSSFAGKCVCQNFISDLQI